MKKSTTDKLLDLAGSAAVIVPAVVGGLPSWLTTSLGIVAWLLGKASTPGVPFKSKSLAAPIGVDPEDPIPPSKRKEGAK